MLLFCLISTVVSWDYETQSSWDPLCAASNASPRVLDPTTATQISSSLQLKMEFLGNTGSQTIMNTGNLIRLVSNLGYIEVGDVNGRRTFNVAYVDFHTPSEHKIGGTFFPMEMEIVCIINDKDWDRFSPNLAIVSVIIQNGTENYFFDTIKSWRLPQSTQNNLTLNATSNINLRDIVSISEAYWYYNGTGTTPDENCQQNVLWYIIQNVKQIAPWQMAAFQSIFPAGNAKTINPTSPILYYSSSLINILSILFLLIT